MCNKWFLWRNPPPKKIPPIRTVNVHIHIPKNSPVKFHDNPIDSLGGVGDKGPLYMIV